MVKKLYHKPGVKSHMAVSVLMKEKQEDLKFEGCLNLLKHSKMGAAALLPQCSSRPNKRPNWNSHVQALFLLSHLWVTLAKAHAAPGSGLEASRIMLS